MTDLEIYAVTDKHKQFLKIIKWLHPTLYEANTTLIIWHIEVIAISNLQYLINMLVDIPNISEFSFQKKEI